MKYLIILITLALVGCGSQADFQQMARASCALTMNCYAPGVTPGTNPYNPMANKLLTAPSPAPKVGNSEKKVQRSFPVDGYFCPYQHGNLYKIGQEYVKGKLICKYG